jgi:hypothetical protein
MAKPFGLKLSSESVDRHTLVKAQGRVFDATRLLALASRRHGKLWSPSETQHPAVVLPAGRLQGL